MCTRRKEWQPFLQKAAESDKAWKQRLSMTFDFKVGSRRTGKRDRDTVLLERRRQAAGGSALLLNPVGLVVLAWYPQMRAPSMAG